MQRGPDLWRRAVDRRTGGAYRYAQRRGEDYFGFRDSFHEVRPNEVLVQTFTFDAEECISYGLPAFRVHGKVVAGFAAFKNHSATCHITARSSTKSAS